MLLIKIEYWLPSAVMYVWNGILRSIMWWLLLFNNSNCYTLIKKKKHTSIYNNKIREKFNLIFIFYVKEKNKNEKCI